VVRMAVCLLALECLQLLMDLLQYAMSDEFVEFGKSSCNVF